jgi:phosphoglycolate phosphatase-like HAD superfamily hydrolase
MPDHVETLNAFEKTEDFFVGIDSDGCAFDTMEIKHKECFIPNIINHWELQPVSRFAREAAEFVNLYSRHRGCNRFIALLLVFDLLCERPEAIERGYEAPQVGPLRDWVKRETRLSSATLEAEVKKTNDPVLAKALAWSDAVNETVAKIVRNCPPFPHLRESLAELQGRADIMVVSATPDEALRREWEEHDIAGYVQMICGQELGSKAEHIQYGAGGKYQPEKILMVGDAPGDMKAAKANNALFFPVIPGREPDSWKRLHDEAIGKFLSGDYGGAYETGLIEEFLTYLPEEPPWKTTKAT